MMIGALVFSILPLLALLHWLRATERDWRESSVLAALGWGAGLLVGTEILGLFKALAFFPVLFLWLLAHGIVGALVWRSWRGAPRLAWAWPAGWFERLLLAALGVLLALTLAVAAFAPPNTPDALSYHLPRQLMWLQQGGVQHFVTLDDRALMMPPLCEMIQAHAMVLSGGDGWANFPQWLAYGLGMIVVSLLGRELGGGHRAQGLAALVFATLPMAYLEASSAKNDLLVAVWLAVLAWLALRMAREKRVPPVQWLAAGTALGLALATKTTAFIFAAPILAMLLPAAGRALRRAWLLPAVALARIFHTLSGFFGRPRANGPACRRLGAGRRSVIVRVREMRAKSKTAAVLPIARTLQTAAIAAKTFAHAGAAHERRV